jgi:tetratricopeptide (TPR) repeat protein
MARLDRLATARQIAQIGATLGREFDYALLQAVAPLHKDRLQQELRQLVEAELVYQSGLPPQARYLFKHALVQETAYQSLLKSRRQRLHQQVAQVLEEQFPDTVERQPELVAHHYSEAGLTAHAIPYYERAGERARQRSAHAEAISHLTKGLELLMTLPDTPERARQELPLQVALGVPLMITKGYATPELERACTRARELCREVGELPQLFSILAGLWVFYEHRPEYHMAHELAEDSLREAQRMQDPAQLMWGHYFLGETLRFLGQSAFARVHLEKALTLYDPPQHRALVFRAGGDPGTDSLTELALALWALGYPDEALKKLHAALSIAREVSYPFNSATAFAYAAWLHSLRRDGAATKEWAEATITLAREQRFPYWLAIGTILRGSALVEQGQGEEGLAQLHQGLVAYRAISAWYRPHLLALLAEAHGKVGQTEEGVSTLDEALTLVHTTGEQFYEAELYRLRGTLTLQQQSNVHGPKSTIATPQAETEAEAYFHTALAIARRQQAKSLELRTSTSLARLWHQQGKQAEARQLLTEIYGWFIEGFDTKDLQEAKALLEELH